MKKLLLLSVFACTRISMLYAQPDFSKAIKVGDKVPDIVFQNVWNHSSGKLRLSDLKGKLVILDFWGVTCSSCIDAFPEMERLQRLYKDQLQILLVNDKPSRLDNIEGVKKALDKNKERRGFYPSLPMPLLDTILNSYFPRISIPHEVWVDKEGTVIAITSGREVNEKNINTYLATGKVSMPLKDDWAYDFTKPVLPNANIAGRDEFVMKSILTEYRPEFPDANGMRLNEESLISGIYRMNTTLRAWTEEAYREMVSGVSENRVILETDQPERFKRNADPKFRYCYDLSFPPQDYAKFSASGYLRGDLKRLFNISVRKEKRRFKVFVVSGFRNPSIHSRYRESDYQFSDEYSRKYIHAWKVADILSYFSNATQLPLIDEALIQQKIDLEFPSGLNVRGKDGILNRHDTMELIKFLKASGFTIREEEREMDVVIISDK